MIAKPLKIPELSLFRPECINYKEPCGVTENRLNGSYFGSLLHLNLWVLWVSAQAYSGKNTVVDTKQCLLGGLGWGVFVFEVFLVGFWGGWGFFCFVVVFVGFFVLFWIGFFVWFGLVVCFF